MGSPGTRELLVLKLLEERRRNAARLQQQLHDSYDDENNLNDNDNGEYGTGNEREIFSESETENDYVEYRNSYSNNGRDEEKLFKPVSGQHFNAEQDCIFIFFFLIIDNFLYKNLPWVKYCVDFKR